VTSLQTENFIELNLGKWNWVDSSVISFIQMYVAL